MRLKFLCLVVTASLFLLPLKIISQDHDPLLNDEDILLEYNDRENRPALSASLKDPEYWESYNQWVCFDASEVELIPAEVESRDRKYIVPLIHALYPGHFFEFSIIGETDALNAEIFSSWQNLLQGTQRVCIYAAYLQDIEDVEDESSGSHWIVNKLKTENGYWTYGEYSDEQELVYED